MTVNQINYRTLLIKYIRHVIESEGWSYIGDEDTGLSDVKFTDWEKLELKTLLVLAKQMEETQ